MTEHNLNVQCQFDDLLEQAQCVLWTADPQTATLHSISDSAHSLFGRSSSELLNENNWIHCIIEEDRQRFLDFLNHATTTPQTLEYRIDHPDKGQLLLSSTCRLRQSEGNGSAAIDGLTKLLAEDGSISRLKSLVKEQKEEIDTIHRMLAETSRKAGLAEVSIGVLHNIGNALNTVNVAGQLIIQITHKSKHEGLKRIAEFLSKIPEEDLSHNNPKLQKINDYLLKLCDALAQENGEIESNSKELILSVKNINNVITAQQDYARAGGKIETFSLVSLLENALNVNASFLKKGKIKIDQKYSNVPDITSDRQKVLQILVNLINNAQRALKESTHESPTLTVRLDSGENGMITIEVEDNGVGISEENVDKIFDLGFTTKGKGSGFGLHNSARTARELGGTLTGSSKGTDQGALFILQLPPQLKHESTTRVTRTTESDSLILPLGSFDS